ncbi:MULTISPECIES: UDP-4-amino-4,6-dideoxy-N-acetyl-beta-L-altrosamine N-acetyltransferase [Pelosinus]|uniref:Pseudaminic acid biosynthesis N-acetyl transferase n=1 Tax=Pelosinus fermentans B4 TaxID=1149862 RepID=I8RP52_9FIRM|nr:MULTISPECIES: UDP-4-amino-4,6-dideoxy-N-acetyl-beta-L-altrosamine N-acetyltransferase [Pelosinus]EIW20925.1 pseudaminic acid biosynthesis N-acetyl transferase [Pelosinus fermentans B4]EIW27208.1 pseudaminic acid biosynthesis N-acetyl transferase [Pelosinus fermentans A11]
MLNQEQCHLRNMQLSDLEQVLQWRNSERIRNCMFNDEVISLEEHVAWFTRVTQEQKSHHLIFEYCNQPIGVVNITQVDCKNETCYWGFYIGNSLTPSGSGLAMGFYGLNYIFSELRMRKLCGEVLDFNIPSVNYHITLGFIKEGQLRKHVCKNGNFEDVICLGIFKEEWQNIKQNIAMKCFDLGG